MQSTVAGTGAAAVTEVGAVVAASFRVSLNSNTRKAVVFLHLLRHRNRTKAAGRTARACAETVGCCCFCGRDWQRLREPRQTHPSKGTVTATSGDKLYCFQPWDHCAGTCQVWRSCFLHWPSIRLGTRQPLGRTQSTAAIHWCFYISQWFPRVLS